ncbi:MAG: efflux RND transporter periplasmic adaptor subunit [Acidobacteria bacterium]|nr:efflux RND transporter periplasmic adaptor subunit [Acidobacteriota bacterium]
MKPRMFRSHIIILFTISVVASACGGGPTGAPPGGAGAFPPMAVDTLTLTPQPVADASEFVATIQSLRSTTVQPQVEGIVRQVMVRAGDRVAVGQPLIQIDPDKQQATNTVTESQRASRDADLAYASQQLARLQKLYAAGAVSLVELEQAETTHANAEAQLESVRSQIRENQVELEYYRVTAPSAGVAGDIIVRQGDRVTPSTTITTIDESAGLEAYIYVPVERATALTPGLLVELLNADGEVVSSNPISFIASRADDATQSVLVKAALRQLPVGFRVKQYVRARIVWSNEPTLTVPVIAVSRLAGQYFVFVAEQTEDGVVARQTPVTLGALAGDDYIVQGGLAAGDRVIVSNVQKLGDGAPVQPS